MSPQKDTPKSCCETFDGRHPLVWSPQAGPKSDERPKDEPTAPFCKRTILRYFEGFTFIQGTPKRPHGSLHLRRSLHLRGTVGHEMVGREGGREGRGEEGRGGEGRGGEGRGGEGRGGEGRGKIHKMALLTSNPKNQTAYNKISKIHRKQDKNH